jgi:hypothetical protein
MFFRKNVSKENNEKENITNINQIIKSIKGNKLLLSNRNITFFTIKNLERGLLGINNVASIDLSNNLIGDSGLRLLIPLLSKKNIKNINLSCTNLTDYSGNIKNV